MKITVLGCGSSAGVPHIIYGFGDCDPSNPKNVRTRASVLVEVDGIDILIDVSPDFREQFFREKIKNIDAILMSHEHYDHSGGLPELRPLMLSQRKTCPLYACKETFEKVYPAVPYLFYVPAEKNDPARKPVLEKKIVETGTFSIEKGDSKVDVFRFDIWHGFSWCSGFKIGKFVYTTDISDLPEKYIDVIADSEYWMVDCLSRRKKLGHANVDDIISWSKIVKPRNIILTHMDCTMDYDSLIAELPENIFPAYDGLQIFID